MEYDENHLQFIPLRRPTIFELEMIDFIITFHQIISDLTVTA